MPDLELERMSSIESFEINAKEVSELVEAQKLNYTPVQDRNKLFAGISAASGCQQ